MNSMGCDFTIFSCLRNDNKVKNHVVQKKFEEDNLQGLHWRLASRNQIERCQTVLSSLRQTL